MTATSPACRPRSRSARCGTASRDAPSDRRGFIERTDAVTMAKRHADATARRPSTRNPSSIGKIIEPAPPRRPDVLPSALHRGLSARSDCSTSAGMSNWTDRNVHPSNWTDRSERTAGLHKFTTRIGIRPQPPSSVVERAGGKASAADAAPAGAHASPDARFRIATYPRRRRLHRHTNRRRGRHMCDTPRPRNGATGAHGPRRPARTRTGPRLAHPCLEFPS